MVRVGYSRELSISWVMETFCGLSVMTVITSTFLVIMTWLSVVVVKLPIWR